MRATWLVCSMKLTTTVTQNDLFFIRHPSVAGELHIVALRGLHCDVPAVPVILHPVFPLLNLHQLNMPKVLAHIHFIRVHLG